MSGTYAGLPGLSVKQIAKVSYYYYFIQKSNAEITRLRSKKKTEFANHTTVSNCSRSSSSTWLAKHFGLTSADYRQLPLTARTPLFRLTTWTVAPKATHLFSNPRLQAKYFNYLSVIFATHMFTLTHEISLSFMRTHQIYSENKRPEVIST